MGGLGITLPGLLTQLVSFLVLFGLLYLVLYKPMTRMLDSRSSRIRESLEAADRARQEAASSAEQVERELGDARNQGQALIAEARTAASQFRQQEDARTRAEMEAMLERARAEIERERDAAVEQVRRQFADLAITAAERVVERSLDKDAHAQLIDKVLEEGLAKRRN
jgi:F-type H+-transporting ATPase subunit b